MADQSPQPAPRKPKLSLRKETLRAVSDRLLEAVVGGGGDGGGGGDTPTVGSCTHSPNVGPTDG